MGVLPDTEMHSRAYRDSLIEMLMLLLGFIIRYPHPIYLQQKKNPMPTSKFSKQKLLLHIFNILCIN